MPQHPVVAASREIAGLNWLRPQSPHARFPARHGRRAPVRPVLLLVAPTATSLDVVKAHVAWDATPWVRQSRVHDQRESLLALGRYSTGCPHSPDLGFLARAVFYSGSLLASVVRGRSYTVLPMSL